MPPTFSEAPNFGACCHRHFPEEKCHPNVWKPLTCGCIATALFISRKMVPFFWKPSSCGYVAAGAFFLQKNAYRFGSDWRSEAVKKWKVKKSLKKIMVPPAPPMSPVPESDALFFSLCVMWRGEPWGEPWRSPSFNFMWSRKITSRTPHLGAPMGAH